jgi:hypothetical protein
LVSRKRHAGTLISRTTNRERCRSGSHNSGTPHPRRHPLRRRILGNVRSRAQLRACRSSPQATYGAIDSACGSTFCKTARGLSRRRRATPDSSCRSGTISVFSSPPRHPVIRAAVTFVPRARRSRTGFSVPLQDLLSVIVLLLRRTTISPVGGPQ